MRVVNTSLIHQRKRLRVRKQKLLRVWVTLTALVVLAAGTGYMSYQRPLPVALPVVSSGATLAAETVPLAWPAYGQAAIGSTVYGLLESHGETTPVPTASTAKVMTALAVLRQKPMLPNQPPAIITVDAVDIATLDFYRSNDGSHVPVTLGQQLTQYQALQALLLPSANNVADMLARWAFGSMEAYTAYANNLAATLGMTQTTIADASGFSPETKSTAHDLVLMGIAAISEPVIAEIVSQPSASLPGVGVVRNTNRLLGQNGNIGLKTGNTDEAGGCYLFAGTQTYSNGKQITVVGAIMTAPSLSRAMSDSLSLLQTTYEGFGDITLATKGEVFANYSFDWGGSVQAVAKEDLKVFGWKGMVSPRHANVEPADHLTLEGSSLGSVSAGTLLATGSVPLVAKGEVVQPSLGWRLKRLLNIP